jgi:molybdate transport system substrate-binding protein
LKALNIFLPLFLLLFFSLNILASEKTIHLAVASNFYFTAEQLVRVFEEAEGIKGAKVSLATGSSGVLASQVVNGAPFDLFFSADEVRIDKLVAKNHVRASDTRIYAIGKLMLIARRESDKPMCGLLDSQKERRIALAKPELAPYGVAAKELMFDWGLNEGEQDTIFVYGNNLSQVAQFFSQKAVDYAWLSASQKHLFSNLNQSFCFYKPEVENYKSIVQKMALLKPENPSAKAFWVFLKSKRAKEILLANEYILPVIGEKNNAGSF